MDDNEILPGSEQTPARRRLPLKVLVAATVGAFAFGGVGLAAADVLPARVQDVAHTALDKVGVHVPPGHDRFDDPEVCPGGPYPNHGAYVRAHEEDGPEAGRSPCGRPVRSTRHPDAGDAKDEADADRPDGAGPPPWARANAKIKPGREDGAGPPPWARANGKNKPGREDGAGPPPWARANGKNNAGHSDDDEDETTEREEPPASRRRQRTVA
jgi:hypothetical protein